MTTVHAVTMIITGACTSIIGNARTIIIRHACTMIMVYACTMVIVHARAMIIVNACTMIRVHACTLIVPQVSCPAGSCSEGLGERSPQTSRRGGGRQAAQWCVPATKQVMYFLHLWNIFELSVGDFDGLLGPDSNGGPERNFTIRFKK